MDLTELENSEANRRESLECAPRILNRAASEFLIGTHVSEWPAPSTIKRTRVKCGEGHSEDEIENAVVKDPCEQKTRHAEALVVGPIEKAAACAFGHQERDGGVSIERRHGQQS